MKILVCDDDRFARDLMSAMLKSLANDVILADCGEAAISAIENDGVIPDLILLDVIMPGLNGYQTAERLRPLTADRHVPILFLTSLTSEDTATKCLDYGDDFLTKPVTMEVLHAKLLAHFRFVNLYNEVQEKNKKLTYFYQNTAYEQEIVKDIFDSFMVKNELSSDVIRYHISPMSTFNGDILLASKSEIGSYYVLVADFTGHGLPAAIGTMPISHTFFSLGLLYANQPLF